MNEIVIDLPFPPSVNRIWRSKKAGKQRVFLSVEYRRWKKAADDLVLSMAALRGVRTIRGKFTADIVCQRPRNKGDLDNRIKAVLDFAQSRALVVNDGDCEQLSIKWGDAPTGCRLTLRAVA